ncbi:MAG: twin-arginine translocation signal domain-containing protein [Acidobacteria bacterium]|nr:twin-arginine translocation signal domain-containing protein [Acidobacteriota bacterium]
MRKTRREFITGLAGLIGAVGIVAVVPNPARACIYGTWVVRCRNGHDDTVTRGTCNHYCEKSGCREKSFSDGAGNIVCPDSHANYVNTGTSHDPAKVLQSYKCRTCGKECRRDI